MLPLSFKEFLDFTQKNESETLEDKLNEYIRYGGMPGVISLSNNDDLYENDIKGINDNYEKTVITMDKFYGNTSEDGIKVKYLIDFLMDESM